MQTTNSTSPYSNSTTAPMSGQPSAHGPAGTPGPAPADQQGTYGQPCVHSPSPAYGQSGQPQVNQPAKKLTRPRDDRVIGGVCAGIARYFGWDPTIVRIAAVASILLPGPQILAYLVAWLFIPQDPA
jgi:phage shock protein PspC (stress-responsive transcriptional regulator)